MMRGERILEPGEQRLYVRGDVARLQLGCLYVTVSHLADVIVQKNPRHFPVGERTAYTCIE